MDQKAALKTVKKFINYLNRNNYNVKSAYSFGSFAKGDFSEDSDIDLAIIIKNLKNGFNEIAQKI